MIRQLDLSPNIFRLLDHVIEGKPVSKTVLEIVIKLAGFDRGAVFLGGRNKELKLAVSVGVKYDRKTVEILARRSDATASSPIEYEPDTTKLNWFRKAHQLRGSFILSFACIAIVRGKKLYGTLYLDSMTTKEPITKTVTASLSRLARVMLGALLHDQIITVPTIAASDYLTRHSLRDLERERLLAVLRRYDWHVYSASQDMRTNVRTLYTRMKRFGIEPARTDRYRKRETVEKLRRGIVEL